MCDYALTHEGKNYTPIEAVELAYWATKPDRMFAYYSFPAEYRSTFGPLLTGAKVSTWTGKELGIITSARVYQHNFGSRMVAITVTGNNGANYYGRASYDWGTCINLRKCKS